VAYYRDDILLRKFGKNLKKLREVNHLTQEELSYLADLDISQVGRIERGEVNTSLCVLQRIAKALKIEMKELFDF
jgi:transcriptional regulator with XRE-family HTH domain